MASLGYIYDSSRREIELQEIVNSLINTQMYNSLRILITLLFIIVGIGFKLSPAPSHHMGIDTQTNESCVRNHI